MIDPMRSPGFEQRAASRSLLVVEDDPDIRDALGSLLSMEGFRVAGCSNGREALDWLRMSPKPDLILLDLMMPVMDGWQFRVVQKGDPQFASIPVLALSADATAKAAAIDAEAYLKKPVDYDTLIDTIDQLLVESEHRDLQAGLAMTDRLTSLGTLAAGVAHEINNPLAYVLLNIQYVSDEITDLLSDRADDRTRELRLSLDHARSGAERIRDIVRGLKTFSRPDNDTRQSLDVVCVLDATLAMVHNEIRHRARLIKDYAQVPNVFANEARLGQVFLNLLMNAVQSLPEDRPSSNDIRVVVKASGVERVVIEVKDNGVGIPTQVRGRIFEPFFTTKPVGIGTGLGLAICHGIVTSLGGMLSFETEVGVGTTFRVDLPAVRESTDAAAIGKAQARDGSAPAVSGDVRRVRALIVDDEPSVCFALERLLSKWCEVVAVTRARDALACIEAGDRFDVLFCDLMLPDMDGQALHDTLRVIDPTQAERMVFVTGGVFTARAQDFLARVPNRRLSKPFDTDILLGIVRERAGR